MFMAEMRILKKNAHQNPSTVNPGTILPAMRISKALITNKNKPNVISVIGNVRRMMSGLTKRFKIPKTSATKSAVQKLSTCTPGRIYAAIIITTALANQLSNNPISS
jgi:hypothetical protein